MMIIVNGESTQVVDMCTLSALIEILGLLGERYAVEVNLNIIPRSQHASYCLQSGDRVEIVRAIGGGSKASIYKLMQDYKK